jgi:hypothetical protein
MNVAVFVSNLNDLLRLARLGERLELPLDH